VPHQIIWSWYTGRWWVGCYSVTFGTARRGLGGLYDCLWDLKG